MSTGGGYFKKAFEDFVESSKSTLKKHLGEDDQKFFHEFMRARFEIVNVFAEGEKHLDHDWLAPRVTRRFEASKLTYAKLDEKAKAHGDMPILYLERSGLKVVVKIYAIWFNESETEKEFIAAMEKGYSDGTSWRVISSHRHKYVDCIYGLDEETTWKMALNMARKRDRDYANRGYDSMLQDALAFDNLELAIRKELKARNLAQASLMADNASVYVTLKQYFVRLRANEPKAA